MRLRRRIATLHAIGLGSWIHRRHAQPQSTLGWCPSWSASSWGHGCLRLLASGSARWQADACRGRRGHRWLTSHYSACHHLPQPWRLACTAGKWTRRGHSNTHSVSRWRSPLLWRCGSRRGGAKHRAGAATGWRRCHHLTACRTRATDASHVGRNSELGAASAAFELDDVGTHVLPEQLRLIWMMEFISTN